MVTYALVGDSGTGKSYNSINIAARHNLEYIIDDGILIHKNKVVAGYSAKKEETIVGAVKRAVFTYDDHCSEVKEAIINNNVEGILVLGTSVKMVEKIRTRLDLPEYTQIIAIEDVVTSEEITKAKFTRQNQGKHVIPVPVMEIKKTFSGYFLDPLKPFRKSTHIARTEDKSIVRPTYSYMGEFSINDTVLCTLASYEASKCEGVEKINRISVDKDGTMVIFNVDAVLSYGVNIRECAESIKRCIKESIEKYASVYTDIVNVSVRYLK